MSNRSTAQQYIDRGWSIVPIHRGTKRPTTKWTQLMRRQPTPAQLDRWFAKEEVDIAIVTGPISGLVVIDFDDPAAVSSLEQEVGTLPRTLSVRSARGVHLYFRYPTGTHIKSMSDLLPKVDVRATAGYIVAPPSVHATGHIYTWVDPACAIAVLPSSLLAVLSGEIQPGSSEPDTTPAQGDFFP